MTRPSFLIDVRRQRGGALERDLRSGGLFVPGARHPLNQHCEVTFRFHDTEQSMSARVVFSDVQGVGLELFMLPPERAALVEKIRSTHELPVAELDEEAGPTAGAGAALGAPPGDDGLEAAAGGDGGNGDDGMNALPGAARGRGPAHLRVRNLSVAEQLRLAHHGEQQERMLLERLYGKTVWEALLRNPRITAPEVARIARMGALPKPLLELIVGNSAWLQIPEIRRALLGNPRLAPEMIGRVLRLLPRHELKLVPAQLAYPAPVRDVARRMLREQG